MGHRRWSPSFLFLPPSPSSLLAGRRVFFFSFLTFSSQRQIYRGDTKRVKGGREGGRLASNYQRRFFALLIATLNYRGK